MFQTLDELAERSRRPKPGVAVRLLRHAGLPVLSLLAFQGLHLGIVSLG